MFIELSYHHFEIPRGENIYEQSREEYACLANGSPTNVGLD